MGALRSSSCACRITTQKQKQKRKWQNCETCDKPRLGLDCFGSPGPQQQRGRHLRVVELRVVRVGGLIVFSQNGVRGLGNGDACSKDSRVLCPCFGRSAQRLSPESEGVNRLGQLLLALPPPAVSGHLRTDETGFGA